MMGRSSPAPAGKTNISATTQKIQVDNRIALRFYFRIADNILKQADIFREENNIVDLYVMLLRFSSLVTETIPCHRDYRSSQQNHKVYLIKKLRAALTELEALKPNVEAKLEEMQSKQIYQQNKQKSYQSNETQVSYVDRPALNQQKWNEYLAKKPVTREFGYQGFNTLSTAKPVEEHLRRISLSIPRAKEETLSKHSILGPNGLRGQWQPPINLKVQYPSNLDFTTPQIARYNNFVQQSVKDEIIKRQDDGSPENEKTSLEPPIQQNSDNQQNKDFDSLISFETEDTDNSLTPEAIAQPSPPPILAEVQDLILSSTCATETENGLDNVSDDDSVCTKDPLQLHIPTKLMDTFMKLAKSNTNKNLETCGVLAGSLKDRKFYITALIVPKQESTSDSCQTTNEEEIFEVQDKQSLFPLGWIHVHRVIIVDGLLRLKNLLIETHPTQSCFMSSIDVHTHYSYQIMLPEAIAIVMAPRDSSRNHGIFRLTPGGMTVIRHCPRRGFHSHDPPSDGSPIYRQCTDVYMNSTLKFDIIDLR